jgi:hypothetical protein
MILSLLVMIGDDEAIVITCIAGVLLTIRHRLTTFASYTMNIPECDD